MTLAIVPPRQSAPPAAARAARRWPVALPWLLAAGTLAQLCVRVWFARARTAPAANPDETGYLLAARWLAGGPGGDLSGNTFYQGGYPLLLSPAYWFSHDPTTVYTTVMVINAVLGAALFPLGYAAARRFGPARRTALPLAWAAALLPATTFFGAFVLADAVLPTLVLGWLLALDRFAREGRTRDAAAASLLVAYTAAVHTRGAVLLAVHLAALAVLVLIALSGLPARSVRWRGPAAFLERLAGTRKALPGPRAALAGLAVTVAGYAAGSALNGRLRAELYPGGVRDLAALLGTRLTTLDGQAWAVSGAVGQIWYLIVSTWGLAGVGIVAVAASLFRRRTPAPTRVMAAVLLAATLGVAYASSSALPDEHRVGNFAYGRYLSLLALVYALAGAAALLRPGARAAARRALGALVVLAGAGVWVTVYAGDRLRTHQFIGFDFPETSFLTGDRTAFHLTEASFAAAGLLCGLLALSRLRRPHAAAAVAVALTGINLAAMTFIMGPSPQRVRPASPLPGPASGGVVMDRTLDWRIRTMLAYPTWWTRIGWTDIRQDRPPAPGVCTVVVPLPKGTRAEASWPAHPEGWRPHANETWSIGWVVWRSPSCAG
ncbi:hypothetical protein [Actinomadura rubrisoli]|uniref:Glycosyltransferase RgtA/B/C/D-like domain-containing protein n=1 Tax=Actinomadura rubrisoli TaxID=2530368 RepID=A0A4R5BDB9_9ACTN|nr:hypothetical protein [Actinomadura rubrisoli]TDD83565.1 hypothetical protein E1298_21105 [Actinomadura rubrisoli]